MEPFHLCILILNTDLKLQLAILSGNDGVLKSINKLVRIFCNTLIAVKVFELTLLILPLIFTVQFDVSVFVETEYSPLSLPIHFSIARIWWVSWLTIFNLWFLFLVIFISSLSLNHLTEAKGSCVTTCNASISLSIRSSVAGSLLENLCGNSISKGCHWGL